MRRLGAWLGVGVSLLSLLAGTGGSGLAQPRGPADVITGVREAKAKRELEAGPNRGAEAAPVAEPTEAAEPERGNDEAEAAQPAVDAAAAGPSAAGAPPGPAQQHQGLPAAADGSGPSSALPVGTVRVRVTDPRERPLAKHPVRLGILKSDGSRESLNAVTDQSGLAVFADLPGGNRQAYRAEITDDGARFGSTPFRLPHDRGYEVHLRRQATTHDASEVVLYVGAVSVELKDERLKIAQQWRLFNAGSSVYVLPKDGLDVPLPEGFTAFQTQETMGDQQVTSTEQGVNLQGSIPPGQVTMLWGFDLPVEGTEMDLYLSNVFPTYAYRVLVDAAPGLSVEVDGLPAAEEHESQGARFLITEGTRKDSSSDFKRMHIHIAGIPGPGPSRWIAASLALLMLGLGLVVSRRPPDGTAAADDLARRKQELLDGLEALAQERQRDEIGPEFFQDEKARLTDALSVVLWEESELRKAGTAAPR